MILCIFASFNENFNRPRNQTINLISKSSSFNNKSLSLMYGQSHDKTKYTTIIGYLENSVFICILLFAILNLVQICTYGKVGIRQKFSCLFHTRPEIWSLLNTRETIFEEKKKWMFSNHFTRRLGWLKTSIPKRLRGGLCTVFLAQSIMNGVLSLQVWKLGIRKHLIYQNAKILINFSLFL